MTILKATSIICLLVMCAALLDGSMLLLMHNSSMPHSLITGISSLSAGVLAGYSIALAVLICARLFDLWEA